MRFFTLILAFCCSICIAQKKSSTKPVDKAIDEFITTREVDAHIRFLSADEMRGRDTGSPELAIAANYIMTRFMAAGVAPANGDSFFQNVALMRTPAPSKVELTLDVNGAHSAMSALLFKGAAANLDKEVIFVDYGTASDFDKVDVRNKIVLTNFGSKGSGSVNEGLSAGSAKRTLAGSRGAVALVEIMSVPGVPWGALSNYFSAPRVTLEGNEQTIPHVLIQPSDTDPLRSLLQKRNGQGRLAIDMPLPAPVFARNVMGVIRGSDATLREEYVAVTAHYDHVGVNRSAGQDSIFNGARDNAIGTTLLIETAQFFAKNPPKRSILLIAYTAEEKGLLGSHWYADHPVVPLKQTIFNLNCDGAGYNDTSIATIIDFNRTTADDLLRQACTAAGLMLKGDPAPEQGLFDRSDNVSLAKKGVPAVNVSPGVKAFDQELMKYYHQPADEVSTLDMVYLAKFYRAMLRGVLLIGNAKGAPAWKEGDKYEAAAKELYAK